MQINSLNSYSFSGLTKNLKKTAYHKYSDMRKIKDCYSNTLAGTIPNDLRSLAKDNDVNNLIKQLRKSADELRKVENLIYKGIDNLSGDDFVEKYQEFYIEEYGSYINHLLNSLCASLADVDSINNITKNASKELKKSLNCDNVDIKFLSEGCFGYVFSISCKDDKENKLMHDKVIKIYKKSTNQNKILVMLYKKIDEESANSHFKNLFLENIINDVYMYKSTNQLMKSAHGVLAEANRALFIKDKVKNIKNSDYIEGFLFDLNSDFAIFEKADDELPEVKQNISLETFGLYHADGMSSGNRCASRMIDYGGITY